MAFIGNEVRVYVDGTMYIDAIDTWIGTLGADKVALASWGPSESQFDAMTISYSSTLNNNPGSSDWTVVSGTWTQQNQVIDGYGTYPRLKSTVSYAANRVVTVRMRTVISGPNLWNVAWVYAKYLDENNRIAAYLRPDGYIELDYTHSGSTQYYVSTQQTTLEITDWHTYTISSLETRSKYKSTAPFTSTPLIPPSELSAWPRWPLQHHGLQETTRDNSTASRLAYPKKGESKKTSPNSLFPKLILNIVTPTETLDASQECKPSFSYPKSSGQARPDPSPATFPPASTALTHVFIVSVAFGRTLIDYAVAHKFYF